MEDTRDLSEFNGSQLKIFRIDESIKGINMCRHTLDVKNWLFFIIDFEMELESVKKSTEVEELKAKMKELSENINIHLAKVNNPRIFNKTIPAKLIDGLNDYQVRLLKIYKESGLEMKLSGDAMSGMGRRG